MLSSRVLRMLYAATSLLLLLPLSSNAGDFMTRATMNGKGVVQVGRGLAFELSSASHVTNLAPSDKLVLMGLKLDLKLSVTKGKPTVIVPWEALATIKERQGSDRVGFWVPLLKVVGDAGQEATISFYGPCEKGDVQAEAGSSAVTLSIGQPFDSCDVLKLTYSERLNGATCVIYQYLINPCSRTMTLTSIELSN